MDYAVYAYSVFALYSRSRILARGRRYLFGSKGSGQSNGRVQDSASRKGPVSPVRKVLHFSYKLCILLNFLGVFFSISRPHLMLTFEKVLNIRFTFLLQLFTETGGA